MLIEAVDGTALERAFAVCGALTLLGRVRTLLEDLEADASGPPP
jgi:hypothetical protein